MSTKNHNASNGTNTATLCPLAGFFGSIVGQISTMINGR